MRVVLLPNSTLVYFFPPSLSPSSAHEGLRQKKMLFFLPFFCARKAGKERETHQIG
jgi:hypothetical protein